MVKCLFIGGPMDGEEKRFDYLHDTINIIDNNLPPVAVEFKDTWEEIKSTPFVTYKLIHKIGNLAIYSLYDAKETIMYVWNQYKKESIL